MELCRQSAWRAEVYARSAAGERGADLGVRSWLSEEKISDMYENPVKTGSQWASQSSRAASVTGAEKEAAGPQSCLKPIFDPVGIGGW